MCPGFLLLHRWRRRRDGHGSTATGWFCACHRPGASSRMIHARARRALMTATASVACAATVRTGGRWPRHPSWRCRPASHPCSGSTASSSKHPAPCHRHHPLSPKRRPHPRPRRHAPSREPNLLHRPPHGPSRARNRLPRMSPRRTRLRRKSRSNRHPRPFRRYPSRPPRSRKHPRHKPHRLQHPVAR